MSEPISIPEAFRARSVLLTGASGFVGKVWLAMALEHLPSIDRIYVLLRRRHLVSAERRFENFVNGSPAFRPLRERLGTELSQFIGSRVEVVEGDVAQPGLGLDPQVASRLHRRLDLVVHCAGLVDFNPDVRKAYASNVEGTLHVLGFVKSCWDAALLHVSTCYVAGCRQGRIEERIEAERTPDGTPWDPDRERRHLQWLIERIEAEHDAPDQQAALRREVFRAIYDRKLDPHKQTLVRTLTRRFRRERLKQALTEAGTRRAQELGWANTYTYTKGMAEALLARHGEGVRWSVFRPSIVESAEAYPFPGWNQGFNASAPLVYAMGTWFRRVPARSRVPFDVVPVDMVCKGLLIAGAALLEGRQRPVYQCSTSERNRFTIGRVCELIDLGHRRYLRVHGETAWERVVRARWDAVPVPQDELWSLGRQRRALRHMEQALRRVPLHWPQAVQRRAQQLGSRLARTLSRMRELDDLVAMYQPFIHDHVQAFVARALDAHPALERDLRFEPERIEWRHYWLDVHMPGLREWAFPLFEGRSPKMDKPDVRFRFPRPVPEAASELRLEGEAAG